MCIDKLENLLRTEKETDRQTDREFKYRGHSYPLWIVGESGPITARTAAALYCRNKLENLLRTDKETHRQTENSITEATLIPCGSSGGAGQYYIHGHIYIHNNTLDYISIYLLFSTVVASSDFFASTLVI